MALNDNSYGSIAEVMPFARHLLDGETTFSVLTIPTLAEVEATIDRVSGILNTALANVGFSVPVSDETAVFACDDWVVRWTVYELRKAYPHLGITESEIPEGLDIYQAAASFVALYESAFKNLGETITDAVSNGIVFTGLNKHSERADPDNTTYEQPKFRRGLFDST